jgi:hypothetical protein
MATILTATAALVLAACGSGAGNETADGNTAGLTGNATETDNETAPPSADETIGSPTAVAGAAPTREYLVGSWGEDGDCTLAIEFRADGTMDGPFEGWTLDGDQLTMIGNPQAMTVIVVDQNAMESVGADGRTRRLTRC